MEQVNHRIFIIKCVDRTPAAPPSPPGGPAGGNFIDGCMSLSQARRSFPRQAPLRLCHARLGLVRFGVYDLLMTCVSLCYSSGSESPTWLPQLSCPAAATRLGSLIPPYLTLPVEVLH
jgi:hypothetical protein